MAFGIMDRSTEEFLKTLDKLPVNPDDLAHWTSAIETTANICAMIKMVKSPSSIKPMKNQ
jgi:hypothetical protein